MKKYLSVILALVMMLAMSVSAIADEVSVGSATNQEVTADYTAPIDTYGGVVYRITLDWEQTESSLLYTSKQSTYTWNTESLVYDESVDVDAGWSGEVAYKITVTNYSDAAVNAAVSETNNYELDLTPPAEKTAVLGSAAVDADSDNAKIEYTDTQTQGTAQVKEFNYSYKAIESADAPVEQANGTVAVGNITVTISVD